MQTVKSALSTLKSGLKFGNTKQIAAVQFLEDVETARVAIANCHHASCGSCLGTGKGCELPCEDCGGTGTVIACNCFRWILSEAVIEARRLMGGKGAK